MHDHLTSLFVRFHAACLQRLDRLQHPEPGSRWRSDRGQATTECPRWCCCRRARSRCWLSAGPPPAVAPARSDASSTASSTPSSIGSERCRAGDRRVALCLPLVVVLVLGLVQVALVARDQLAIELAAAKGARGRRVGVPRARPRAAVERAITIRPVDVDVAVGPSTVTVTVLLRQPHRRAHHRWCDRRCRPPDASVTMALEPP